MNQKKTYTNREKYDASPKICKFCSSVIRYEKRRHDFCNHSCSVNFTRENKNHLIEKYSYNKKYEIYISEEAVKNIIEEYNRNYCTIDDISKKYNTSGGTINKILIKYEIPKRKFIPSKRKLTEEQRIKHSNAMKKCHAEGRHPGWTAVNSKKESSYPEIQFLNFIQNCEYFKGLTIKEKFPISRYVLDFVIVEYKIDIEMDGQFHFNDANTIQKDKNRDEYMISNGWRVFRVSWTKFKDSREEIEKELIAFIENTKMSITKQYTTRDIVPIKKSNKYGNNQDYRDAIKEEKRLGTYAYIAKRKFEASKEELEQLIKEKPMTEIGKMFGVSGNAVKKRCQVLGIELRDMRGYWSSLRKKQK